MEFLDEYESRPRFIQSKQSSSDLDQSLHKFPSLSSLHKPTLLISLSFSIFILFVTIFYFNDIEPLKSVLLWLSLSFFFGPFAPSSLTAGDIRVGVGPPIAETLKKETLSEPHEKFSRKFVNRQQQPAPSEVAVQLDGFEGKSGPGSKENGMVNRRDNGVDKKKLFDGESEWSDVDWELLRKLVVKHPVGKPGRWEAIAEGLKGKHSVESVIAKAKELGQRKVSDQDSYQKFLKDRKSVDQRVIDETSANQVVEEGGKVESGWSVGEDLALLNALKTFPKDVAMRWEKIAASLPGKTKAGCMKRVSELKKDFRSSKAS